jgi:prepilin-type N-terminal cleavage/methylation domain-containing protein
MKFSPDRNLLIQSSAKAIRFQCSRNNQGFTLIELTMVILLVGLMLTITLPNLRNMALSDNLKNTLRTLTSTVNELRYQAIRESRTYYLNYDFGTKKFWVDSSYLTIEERTLAKQNAVALSSDIYVIDIIFLDGEVLSTGQASIGINRDGYADPAVIHLGSDDGRQFTFVLRPFLASVNIVKDYVKISDVKL